MMIELPSMFVQIVRSEVSSAEQVSVVSHVGLGLHSQLKSGLASEGKRVDLYIATAVALSLVSMGF